MKIQIRQLSKIQVALTVFAVLVLVAVAVSVYDYKRENIRGDLTLFSLAASRVMFQGGDPYSYEEVGDNFKYLPFNATVLWPLTKVSIPIAQGIWFSFNTGLLFWCFYLHWRWLEKWRIPWWVWVICLLIAFRYLWQNLKMGQWNTSVYCLTFAGLYYSEKRPGIGGGILGIAATLKYMPAFLLLYLLLRRNWSAATGFIVGVVFCALILPTIVLGPQRHLELLNGYYHKANATYADMTVGPEVSSYSVYSTITLLLTETIRQNKELDLTMNVVSLSPQAANQVAKTVSLLILAGAVALTWFYHRKKHVPPGPELLLLAGFWFMILLCISPEVRKAHLLTIFTPLLAIAAWGLCAQRASLLTGATRWVPWATVILAGLFTFLSSSIIESAQYNDYVSYFGGFTMVIIVLGVGSAFCLYQSMRTGGLEDTEDETADSFP